MAKETVGEFLKRERQLRQISIQEVAEGTKISISRLRLIEENRFDDLPAEVFVRGFIRSYADYIGIDPEEAILRLEEDMKEKPLQGNRQQDMTSATPIDVGVRQPRRILFFSVVVLLILLLAAGGYYLFFSEGISPSSKPGTNSTVGTMIPSEAGDNSLSVKEKTGPKILLEEVVNSTSSSPLSKKTIKGK